MNIQIRENAVCSGGKRRCKRAVVLHAAADIFLSRGYSNATIDMVQRASGVSKGTIYSWYSSKETLFAAVIEQTCDTLFEEFSRVDCESLHLDETLRQLGRAYLALLLSPLALSLFRVVIADAEHYPKVAKLFFLNGPKVVLGLVEACLRRFSDSGDLDLGQMETQQAASIYLSLLRNDIHLECLTHPDVPPSETQISNWVNLAVETFQRAFGVQ